MKKLKITESAQLYVNIGQSKQVCLVLLTFLARLSTAYTGFNWHKWQMFEKKSWQGKGKKERKVAKVAPANFQSSVAVHENNN